MEVDEYTGLSFCPGCDRFLALLPEKSSYMISGVSGTGKTAFLTKLIDFYLRNQRTCIYVACDQFPSDARNQMKNFVVNLTEMEGEGLFKIVDCQSCTAGVPSSEKLHVDRPGDLTGMGIVITEALRNSSQAPKVFLESATHMFTYCPSTEVVRFLLTTAAKVKAREGGLFFSLGEGAIDTDDQRKLEQIMDGVITMRKREEAGRILREFRIEKIRGTRAYERWLKLFIGKKTIYIDIPQDPEEFQEFAKLIRG
jgi:KaiC/GvpD/RAD55 family RecA-like ATPase